MQFGHDRRSTPGLKCDCDTCLNDGLGAYTRLQQKRKRILLEPENRFYPDVKGMLCGSHLHILEIVLAVWSESGGKN